ncbi:MFS transporter [Rhodococcus sp. P1Y]|uniref:MFS transporter n=1 Tax=Rhodococcus sp. P1Y TaxID=1302308 RepID=UPI000EB5A5B2|nr:MFS transporter [Rhodococcus sp. P1Y]AYJ48335.1 MFS transporter [Rhodococcus sp. P1Y]
MTVPGSVPDSPSLDTTLASLPLDGERTLPEVDSRYIWLQVLGQFGVFLAFITPVAISLSVRVQELAPGREEYLGYITGSGALAVMLAAPLLGTLSDRTRTRIGKRRPFMIGGVIVGIVALILMALAPSVFLLGTGWILAQLGWGTTLANLQISTADRLPESQRGKVAGLTGFATQVAPVVGVILSGGLVGNSLLLFLVPGAIGVVLVAAFVMFVHENDTRGAVFPENLTVRNTFARYTYNPLQYPDYSLNWLARFLFYLGIAFNTTFTAFFYADRLDMTLGQVAGVMGTLGVGSIVAVTAGALSGGFMSDKFGQRKIFILVGASLFAVGVLTQAYSDGLPPLVVGSLIAALGIGMFSAVDQALLLDVLPERELEAGRFMGITGFATSIPQAVGPFVAPLLLAIGSSGDAKNYPLLFTVAAGVTLLGGFAVMQIRSVR